MRGESRLLRFPVDIFISDSFLPLPFESYSRQARVLNNPLLADTANIPNMIWNAIVTRSRLEVFLPEPELNKLIAARLARSVDLTRRSSGAAEIHTDRSLSVRGNADIAHVHVALIHEAVTHRAKQTLEVRSTILGLGLQLSKRVEIVADGVKIDVRSGVLVDFLGEVGVDAQEFGPAVGTGCLFGLGLERGEEGLEPFEGFD
jgi:hypothetical protein